jgi:hypothetical protein
VIPYPDRSACREALHHLTTNLDPYLEIITQNEKGMIWKDYQDHFGKIITENSTMHITLHFKEKPEFKQQ